MLQLDPVSENDVFAHLGIFLVVVEADFVGRLGAAVDEVALYLVVCAAAGEIDGISVAEHFHDVVEFIVANQVVAGVGEFQHLVGLRGLADFIVPDDLHVLPDGLGDEVALPFHRVVDFEIAGADSADDDCVVGKVVDVVVGDDVVAALPDENGGTVVPHFANVVNFAVFDDMAPVDVFQAGSVSTKQYADAAEMSEFAVFNVNALAVQVDAKTGASGIAELATGDATVFGPAKAEHGIVLVVHVPVVLDSLVLLRPDVPVAPREDESVEVYAPYGYVPGESFIVIAFDSNEFPEARGGDVFAGAFLLGPVVEEAFSRIQCPLARLVQSFQGVFDPGGLLPFLSYHPVEAIGACHGGFRDPLFHVH